MTQAIKILDRFRYGLLQIQLFLQEDHPFKHKKLKKDLSQ